MTVKFIPSEYIALAMAQAVYEELEDGTFAASIPSCPGVIAFAVTLQQCEEELRSTLGDWLLVGFKMGHPLPVIANINLNQEPARESLEAA